MYMNIYIYIYIYLKDKQTARRSKKLIHLYFGFSLSFVWFPSLFYHARVCTWALDCEDLCVYTFVCICVYVNILVCVGVCVWCSFCMCIVISKRNAVLFWMSLFLLQYVGFCPFPQVLFLLHVVLFLPCMTFCVVVNMCFCLCWNVLSYVYECVCACVHLCVSGEFVCLLPLLCWSVFIIIIICSIERHTRWARQTVAPN
jgi:hypothetical protein